MSVTTAKVAGVNNVIATSPPKDSNGANPIIIYTANLCGADVIMNIGGIGAIGALAYGCFGNPDYQSNHKLVHQLLLFHLYS